MLGFPHAIVDSSLVSLIGCVEFCWSFGNCVCFESGEV
jgi:hypothetical protein